MMRVSRGNSTRLTGESWLALIRNHDTLLCPVVLRNPILDMGDYLWVIFRFVEAFFDGLFSTAWLNSSMGLPSAGMTALKSP